MKKELTILLNFSNKRHLPSARQTVYLGKLGNTFIISESKEYFKNSVSYYWPRDKIFREGLELAQRHYEKKLLKKNGEK